MRRIALILPALLGALAVPAGAADAPPTRAGATDAPVPALAARIEACETGPTLADRTAEFSGAMPAVAGASVLAMRFELQQRKGTGPFKALAVPGFKGYQRSVPGADGFVYAKRVERLAAGFSYRVTVRFRWTSAEGRTIRRATKSSAVCRQPDERPDLAVSALVAEPAAEGRLRYVATVRNVGRGATTTPSALRLTVDGVVQPLVAVPALQVRQSAVVVLEGPACVPGGTVRAEVDPEEAVEEVQERANGFVLRCT